MRQITADRQLPFAEFVTLIALMIAIVAFSTDAMLPAMSEIGGDLGVQRSNDNQLIISLLFLGLSVGQLIYGPISDSVGRKPAIYAGFGIFILGSFFSLFATNFTVMLVGRVLQGVGVAGPRIVTVALVRDQYEGRAMARVMSFVMAVFIFVPIIAPSIGQVILLFFHWRMIFGLFILQSVLITIWFALRQPETLPLDRRIPFSTKRIFDGLKIVFDNRIAVGYTIIAGLITGPFLAYLSTAPQIFQEIYGLGALFPVFFAILSIGSGVGSIVNARLVMRYGMERLSSGALWGTTIVSTLFFMVALMFAGQPPLWMVMVYLLLIFLGIGILFGNLNALAMEPLGHVAGIGAAVVGSVTTIIAMLLGILIGQSFDQTVLPLVVGFAVLSFLSILMMQWTNRKDIVEKPI